MGWRCQDRQTNQDLGRAALKQIWDAHVYAFNAHPLLVIAIVLWGVWYTDYKRRATRAEPTREGGHEHRKRIGIAWVTVAIGLLFLPGMVATQDAQAVLKSAAPGISASGPDPAPLPDKIDVDTVYDRNEWYIAELIGNLEHEAGAAEKFAPVIAHLKLVMDSEDIDIESIGHLGKQQHTSHSDLMSLLDMMRCIPYAEHGYQFKRPVMRKFFSSYPWYSPTIADPDQVKASLSATQQDNIDKIAAYEREHWNDE